MKKELLIAEVKMNKAKIDLGQLKEKAEKITLPPFIFMTWKIFLIAAVALFLAAPCAVAKDRCEIPEDEWCPLSVGPVTTWTAPVCERGRLIIQPFFTFNRARGVFNKESSYKSYTDKDKKWQWQQQLFLSYGLTDRLELDLLGTYQQNVRQISGASAESAGFGDTYVYSSYCLLMEKGWLPCVSAWFQLKLPTGKYQKADPAKLGTDIGGATTGGGSYDHGYGFVITKKLKPFVVHADAIWNFPILTKVDGVKVQYGEYARYDLGIEYFFYKGFNLMCELNALAQGGRKDNNNYIPDSGLRSLIIAPGVGWSNSKIQTLLAYQRTIAGANADVNDSIVFTFACTF